MTNRKQIELKYNLKDSLYIIHLRKVVKRSVIEICINEEGVFYILEGVGRVKEKNCFKLKKELLASIPNEDKKENLKYWRKIKYNKIVRGWDDNDKMFEKTINTNNAINEETGMLTFYGFCYVVYFSDNLYENKGEILKYLDNINIQRQYIVYRKYFVKKVDCDKESRHYDTLALTALRYIKYRGNLCNYDE